MCCFCVIVVVCKVYQIGTGESGRDVNSQKLMRVQVGQRSEMVRTRPIIAGAQ